MEIKTQSTTEVIIINCFFLLSLLQSGELHAYVNLSGQDIRDAPKHRHKVEDVPRVLQVVLQKQGLSSSLTHIIYS